MKKIVKIGSKTCGSCGKMSHYDEKVTRELGYEWLNLEKGTEAYKYATDILNEVRKFFGRSIAFPTYAIYEGDKLVHAFMGATDKGTFRSRIQTRDDCQLSGRVQHGGTFHNWIVFVGADGHNVTYDLPKGTYEMGPDIEPLHTNTRYTYTLHSDCTDPDSGDVKPSCGWDQRLEDDGRTLACEDNINGSDESIDYRDLVIYLDEGFGLWVPTSADSGYIDIPDKCGEPEPPPPPSECTGECPPGSQCIPAENRCEWVIVERNIIPACLQFQCCQADKCEEGSINIGDGDCEECSSPDGDINIGDGDGDGLGDCDKRPTPEPVPGSNDRNQTYLYDRLNHTFVFCCPIHADVTWLLPFDTMPPVFQRYVTTTASVRVAAQMVNNPQLFQLLKDRENTLRMECMNYEMEQADLNFLNQPDHSTYMSYQTMQTLNR